MTLPRYLPGPGARRVEQLVGLDRYTLRAVERRVTGWGGGDYALVFHTQKLAGEFVRVLRLTEAASNASSPKRSPGICCGGSG